MRHLRMSIDRALRGAWLRLLAATLPRPGGRTPADARRVLVLRHDRLGDMLSSLGMLRALAQHGLEVDVLASAENAVVLRENPWGIRTVVLRDVFLSALRMRRVLRPRRYDAVIDALALKPAVNTRTAHLMAASGAPVRIGIGGRRGDAMYTHAVAVPRAGANHAEYLAALAAAMGARSDLALEPTALPLSPIEVLDAGAWWRALGGGPRLLVNISAGSAERQWPIESYRAVLAGLRLSRPSLRVAVSSAPGDRAAAGTLAETGATIVSLPLRGALALVRDADVVLTPDTSIAHVAAGFQRPAVVMIARGQLAFAPWRGVGRLVIADAPSLHELTPAQVIAAVEATLGPAGAGAHVTARTR